MLRSLQPQPDPWVEFETRTDDFWDSRLGLTQLESRLELECFRKKWWMNPEKNGNKFIDPASRERALEHCYECLQRKGYGYTSLTKLWYVWFIIPGRNLFFFVKLCMAKIVKLSQFEKKLQLKRGICCDLHCDWSLWSVAALLLLVRFERNRKK